MLFTFSATERSNPSVAMKVVCGSDVTIMLYAAGRIEEVSSRDVELCFWWRLM